MPNDLRSIASLNNDDLIDPVFLFRPNALSKAVSFFQKKFSGKILYAVKTNPDENVIKQLYDNGIKNFDVASLCEIEKVLSIAGDVRLYFMHPVKPRYAIKKAYFEYGVRDFSLDCKDELDKILTETNYAKDLNLHVRLSIPNTYSEISLSEKFGINLQEAPLFLKKVSRSASSVGICFHVGSQCMHPDAYRIAIRMAKEVIAKSKVKISYFNVGGGFPSVYPGMIPPDLSEYFAAIDEEFANVSNSGDMVLMAEPGRSIVAESMSLVVRVDLRKENRLYINDGTYGSLFDAGTPQFIFPVRLLDTKSSYSSSLVPFSFYGPTCDSLDFMKGPFYLPKEIAEGDYIEIGQMGAYAKTMATDFNGFRSKEKLIYIKDEPLMTMYSDEHVTDDKFEVIAA